MSTERDAHIQRIQERGKQVRALAVEIARGPAAESRLDELARAIYEFDDMFQPADPWPSWTGPDVAADVRSRYLSKARHALEAEVVIIGGAP